MWRRFNLRRLRFRHPDGELTKLGFPRGPLVRQRYFIGDYLGKMTVRDGWGGSHLGKAVSEFSVGEVFNRVTLPRT